MLIVQVQNAANHLAPSSLSCSDTQCICKILQTCNSRVSFLSEVVRSPILWDLWFLRDKYLSLLPMQHTCMKGDICHLCTISNFDGAPNYQIVVPWAADKCLCSHCAFQVKDSSEFCVYQTFHSRSLLKHCRVIALQVAFSLPCSPRKWYCLSGEVEVLASLKRMWWGIKKVAHSVG